MRKNRIERFLTKEQFLQLTKKPRQKRDFQRKILIFDTQITRTKWLQIQSYFDKETCQSVIFAVSDPHLIQSDPKLPNNDSQNLNISRNLTESERPPLSEYYNLEIGFVDKFDREFFRGGSVENIR